MIVICRLLLLLLLVFNEPEFPGFLGRVYSFTILASYFPGKV